MSKAYLPVSIDAEFKLPSDISAFLPHAHLLSIFCAAQDTGDMDFMLSMSLSQLGTCVMNLLGTIIFIAVIQPWILVGIAPLTIVYYFIQKFYRWGCSKGLRRFIERFGLMTEFEFTLEE